MKKITDGKIPVYCWSDPIEAEAMGQALNVANHPRARIHFSVMPDGHSGYGMPIGGVAALHNAISPYMVGNDIACSMLAVRLPWTIDQFMDMRVRKLIHDEIKKRVPTGFMHNSDHNSVMEYGVADLILSMGGFWGLDSGIVSRESIANQLGTLGGGNHFAELQADQSNRMWVMIHCGSRGIGSNICTKYNKLAVQETGHLVSDKNLSFFDFDSDIGQEYFRHMLFCMEFSRQNKLVIHARIFDAITAVLGKPRVEVEHNEDTHVHVFHNFASVETHFGEEVVVHRKGATPAGVGVMGIIPGNMGSSSYIVRGLGNPDSFSSCSHGAGRSMSRSKACDSITLSSVNQRMAGIYFDSCKEIIDESPDAYKNIKSVMEAQTIGDDALVEIVHELRPLINVKDTSKKREKGVKNKDRTCPSGHLFGTDFDLYKDCKPSFCSESSRNACRHRMKCIVLKKTEKDND